MADLNNLLDEMEVDDDDGVDVSLSNNDNDYGDGIQNDDDEGDVRGVARNDDDAHSDNAETDDPLPSRRPDIPSALAIAAQQQQQQQQHRLQEEGLRKPRSGPYDDDYDNDHQFPSNEDGDDDDNEQNQREGERILDQDYEQLKQLWISELTSPELMPHDSETVALHVEVLAGQEESVEELWGMSRVHRGEGEGSGGSDGGPTGEMASLMAQILKMDVDRTRFMLVDLARSRMAKIENHALFNRELVDRMTDEEVKYLKNYGELLEKYHRRTVLNHLPKEAYRKLDEPEMIDAPDLEQFVFCRVLETVQIDVRSQTNGNGKLGVLGEEDEEEERYEDEDLDGIQEHEPGSCLIVMYKVVRDLILEGKIELML